MKKLILLSALAVVFASCSKEDKPEAAEYTYLVNARNCQVKFLNPLTNYQFDEVNGAWQHTVLAKPGAPISVKAYNTIDSSSIYVEIKRNGHRLVSGYDMGKDVVVNLTVTAE